MTLRSTLVLLLLFTATTAYQLPYVRTTRSVLSMRRGRGSFQKESGGNGMGGSKKSGGLNWCPIPQGQSLPTQNGQIGLLDTELPTMKNGATNPTGAVAVGKIGDELHCFASSCPSCQIPLTKAQLVDGPPRIACGFCKSTYQLKDGRKVESLESGGLFGGIVKSVFSAKETGNLPIYKLGEKNGKMLIVVDQS